MENISPHLASYCYIPTPHRPIVRVESPAAGGGRGRHGRRQSHRHVASNTMIRAVCRVVLAACCRHVQPATGLKAYRSSIMQLKGTAPTQRLLCTSQRPPSQGIKLSVASRGVTPCLTYSLPQPAFCRIVLRTRPCHSALRPVFMMASTRGISFRGAGQ